MIEIELTLIFETADCPIFWYWRGGLPAPPPLGSWIEFDLPTSNLRVAICDDLGYNVTKRLWYASVVCDEIPQDHMPREERVARADRLEARLVAAGWFQ
jgi:hypothetical protein